MTCLPRARGDSVHAQFELTLSCRKSLKSELQRLSGRVVPIYRYNRLKANRRDGRWATKSATCVMAAGKRWVTSAGGGSGSFAPNKRVTWLDTRPAQFVSPPSNHLFSALRPIGLPEHPPPSLTPAPVPAVQESIAGLPRVREYSNRLHISQWLAVCGFLSLLRGSLTMR